jgi:hypothetical protein
MSERKITPFMKAEEFVHTLVNGDYFFEVLVWLGVSIFLSLLPWFILKKKSFFLKRKVKAKLG